MSDQQRAGEVSETSELRYQKLGPETHSKGQATQHGCLPSLLGDGDNKVEPVHGEEKNICTGPT
jgi:hypothetical protein